MSYCDYCGLTSCYERGIVRTKERAAKAHATVVKKIEKPFTMTMQEAVLLMRAAWDGPELSDRERQILTRVLERIEAEQERRRAEKEEA